MVDFNELERRVFQKLNIDPDNMPNDSGESIIQSTEILSVRSSIHVLAEYEKMKQ